jgi:hypothetical protein
LRVPGGTRERSQPLAAQEAVLAATATAPQGVGAAPGFEDGARGAEHAEPSEEDLPLLQFYSALVAVKSTVEACRPRRA